MNAVNGASWVLLVVLATAGLGAVARLRAGRATPGSWRSSALALLLVAVSSGAVLTRLSPAEPTWSGDFRTGDLSQWDDVHVARPDAVVVGSGPTSGAYDDAARFTVRPGDRTFGQTEEERAEVKASQAQSGAVEGSTSWHGWSTWFPEGTAIDEGGWLAFSQWHQAGNVCPPNVAFHLSDDPQPRMFVALRGGALDTDTCDAEYEQSFDLGRLATGVWTDFKVRSTWSSEPSEGSMRIELNGETVLPEVYVANLYEGQGAYFKQGIYRSNSSRTTTVYHAGTARGETEESIRLRACHGSRFPLLRTVAWC